jgi:hypothetical protein
MNEQLPPRPRTHHKVWEPTSLKCQPNQEAFGKKFAEAMDEAYGPVILYLLCHLSLAEQYHVSLICEEEAMEV